jgi:hypothetical protein
MFSFNENKRTAEICRSLQKEFILVQACSHSPLFSPIRYEYMPAEEEGGRTFGLANAKHKRAREHEE